VPKLAAVYTLTQAQIQRAAQPQRVLALKQAAHLLLFFLPRDKISASPKSRHSMKYFRPAERTEIMHSHQTTNAFKL
jgi:hypothetical protein